MRMFCHGSVYDPSSLYCGAQPLSKWHICNGLRPASGVVRSSGSFWTRSQLSSICLPNVTPPLAVTPAASRDVPVRSKPFQCWN